MVVISKAYYDKITNRVPSIASGGFLPTAQQPAVLLQRLPSQIAAEKGRAERAAADRAMAARAAQKEEEDRKIAESKATLAASQQKLAEQTQSMNTFAVNDQADYAQKDVFKTAVDDLSKKTTAELATLKTYVIPQKYADIKRGTTPIETWNLNFDIGRLQQDQSKARAVALRDPTPENIKLADTLKKTQDDYVAKNRAAMYYTDANGVEKARGDVITRVLANFMPQLIDQIAASVPAVALSIGAGILTGGAYTVAEIAAMTTTQLAARAAAIGLTSSVVGQGASAIAGWNQSYDVTMGAAYDNLVSLGVPADRAKALSENEAFWSSLIEMSDNVLDWSLLGFGKVAGAISKLGTGVAADILAKTGKEVVAKSAMRKFVDLLAKYGINILSEGSQEWVQEELSIRSEKQGMSEAGIIRTATAKEDLQRKNAAFQGGAQIAAITGGAALAGTNIATNMINRVNQDTGTTAPRGTVAPVNQTPAAAPVAVNEVVAPVNQTVAPVNRVATVSNTVTQPITPTVTETPSEGKVAGVTAKYVKVNHNGQTWDVIDNRGEIYTAIAKAIATKSRDDLPNIPLTFYFERSYELPMNPHEGKAYRGASMEEFNSFIKSGKTGSYWTGNPSAAFKNKVFFVGKENQKFNPLTHIEDNGIRTANDVYVVFTKSGENEGGGTINGWKILWKNPDFDMSEIGFPTDPITPKVVENPSEGKIEGVKPMVEPVTVISKGSMGEVTRQGNFVYKNTAWKDGKKTLEGEVYQALKDNDNVLKGEVVTVDGVEKIKTPYSENVVSIDTIARDQRARIGEQIIPQNFDNIVNAIADLSNQGYSYSDPLQFAYIDEKLKLMDFSNTSKVETKEAIERNYSHLVTFLRSFGLDGYADTVNSGMHLKTLMEVNTLEDIKDGMTLLRGKEKDSVVDLLRWGVKPNNVYYTKNARMVELPGIAQTEDKVGDVKYIFSEEPLSEKAITDWELNKVYTGMPKFDLQLFAKSEKFAKTVLDDHDSDMEPQALVDGLSDVYEAVYNARKDNDPTTKEYAETLANSLAKEILGRTRSSFVTENESAKEIRDWLKKIYIIPTHVAQEDLTVFKQKFKRIKFASDAMIEKGGANVLGIDVVYGELVSEYPDLFDRTQQDPTGMLRDIVVASNEITSTKEKYLLSEAEINQHAPELAKSLLDSYDDVSEYSTEAEKIAAKSRRSDALEQEFFGRKISQMDSQMLKKKFEVARTKLLARFNREKAEIRSLAKDRQVVALDRLSKKYDAKIDGLNSMLDSEKYTNFWKNELDKKELRDRIDTLRANKNEQIATMQHDFSKKLTATKKQATLNKATAISKFKDTLKAKREESQVKIAERKAINKKLAQMNKVDTKHMRPEYQKPIQALFDAFDIKTNVRKPALETGQIGDVFRTSKVKPSQKLRALQNLANYISDNPEHSLPDYKLKELELLSKKNASQITAKEFDSIYTAFMHLVNLEKLKDQLITNGKLRSAAKISKQAIGNILKNRKIKIDPSYIDTNKPEFAGKLNPKSLWMQQHNPETLCYISDSDPTGKGIITEIVYTKMIEGNTNRLAYKQEAYKIFQSFLKGKGKGLHTWSRGISGKLNNSDLVEVPISKQRGQTVTKMRISKAERIMIFLAEKDPGAKRRIMRGGFAFRTNLSQVTKLTQNDFDTIANGMTPAEKEFADLNIYYSAVFAPPRLNEVHVGLNGYDLIQKNEGHITIMAHPDYSSKTYVESRGKNRNLNEVIEGMSRFQERTGSSKPLILDDAFVALAKDIEATAAYVGYAEPLRNAKMLLTNTEVVQAYRKIGEYQMHDELVKSIRDVELNSTDLGYIDNLAQTVMNKGASAALGLNPSPALKQLVSYALETKEISGEYLLKAQTTSGKKTLEEVKKYSPTLTDRVTGNVSLELGEIGKVATLRSTFGNFHDIPQIVTRGMVAVDRQITLKTWEAAKMEIKAANPTISQEELMTQTARRTEEIVRHTNQAATVHDRSSIGRSKNWGVRAVTMFTSQTNIIFNSTVRDIAEFNFSNKTVKDYSKLTRKLFITYVVASVMENNVDHLIKFLTGKKDDWNPIADFFENIASNFYIVGQVFKAARSKIEYGKTYGYDVNMMPLQLLEIITDAIVDTYTLAKQASTKEVYKSGEHKGTSKWIQTTGVLANEVLSIISKWSGAPLETVVKWGVVGINSLNKQ